MLAVWRFIREPLPQAVFLYGTEARVPLVLTLGLLPPTVPLIFASDVNVAGLASGALGLLTRRLAYEVIFHRARGALSLGGTNAMALRLLGARNIYEIPVYTVDYDAFDEAPGSTPFLPPSERLTVVIVARLVSDKNVEAALCAVGDDEQLLRRVRLVLIGEGPLRETLTAVAGRYPGLDVRFLGAIPRAHVGAVIRRADVLLLPSAYEPWGIVVCEALGMGVPVVATPAVGAAVSLAGTTQAVILTGSPRAEAIREGLHRFVERSHALRDAARAGAAIVRERYDRKENAKRLVALVKALAAGDA